MTSNIIRRRNQNPETGPLDSFSGLVDQLFQNNLNRFFGGDPWGPGRDGSVPVNIQETDKTYEMEIVAPGLKKEDFHLNVNGDLLTVSFEQEQQKEQREDNWIRQEYRMNSFNRSFQLDDTVDPNKISAKYNDGILKLSIPKKESAHKVTKTINIS